MKKFILLAITLFFGASLKSADMAVEKKVKAESAFTLIAQEDAKNYQDAVAIVASKFQPDVNNGVAKELADRLPMFSLDLVRIIAKYLVLLQNSESLPGIPVAISPCGNFRATITQRETRSSSSKLFGIKLERMIESNWKEISSLFNVNFNSQISAMAFNPDGKTMLLGCQNKFDLCKFSEHARCFVCSRDTPAPCLIESIACHPDGKLFALGNNLGEIYIYETNGREIPYTGQLDCKQIALIKNVYVDLKNKNSGHILFLAWSADGQHIYAAAFELVKKATGAEYVNGKVFTFKIAEKI